MNVIYSTVYTHHQEIASLQVYLILISNQVHVCCWRNAYYSHIKIQKCIYNELNTGSRRT